MMCSTRVRTLSLCLLTVAALEAGCDSDPARIASTASASNKKFSGPQFPGSGSSGAKQSIVAGAPTLSCDAVTPLPAGTFGPAPGAKGTVKCFYDAQQPKVPAATIEWIVESAAAGDLVHARLTLNPAFCDNTYGDNAIGWPEKGMGKKPGGPMGGPQAPAVAGGPMAGGPMAGGPMAGGPPKDDMGAHTFRDLVGSDHAEFKLTDASGKLTLHFKADYLTESGSAPSGYASLGVVGGEGKVLVGSAADVVAVSTSLDRNLNACGLSGYTEDSPATDASYTPNPAAPNWDYRVVYDVWVRRAAFGSVGFGGASVDFVHASPSKAGSATIDVTPGDCPPDWPYCTDPAGCCTGAECLCAPGSNDASIATGDCPITF